MVDGTGQSSVKGNAAGEHIKPRGRDVKRDGVPFGAAEIILIIFYSIPVPVP